MRFNTFTLPLALTAAASADLYSLEFFGSADFVGPINGSLTLDLDDFGSGSFLGTVGTNFGPASADGMGSWHGFLAWVLGMGSWHGSVHCAIWG